MRNLKLYVVLTLALMSGIARAQTTNHHVYALFVINMAKYSSWPSSTGELQIVVFGKTKVYDELQKHNGKVVNGSTIKVIQTDNLAEVGTAQVVFVADNKSSALDDVVKATHGKPIVVVGEREGLYKRGACFSFVIMDNNTLRFDMNNTELEKRQIKVVKTFANLANASI